MPKYSRPNSYTSPKGTQDRTGEVKFATAAEGALGVATDVAISPAVLNSAVGSLIQDASTTVKGKIRIGTVAEQAAGILDTVAVTPTGLAAMAIAGAPLASEILAGIAELATQAETNTGTDDARIVTPLKLTTLLTTPPAIGGTTPAAGAFTNLAATGVGTGNIFTSDTASELEVTGALEDLTLSSTGGRVIVNGEEAAANAITLLSAAGGIDADAALQINIATSQNAADAIVINASAGGIDITAAGAPTEDIDITNTAGSVRITAGENAADSVVITSSIGGIDILAAGAAAGEDIDIVATGSSVNISSTENAADAITINASAGGIDITNTGTAGEDIDIASTGASVNISSTENAANAIYLHTNGGAAETILIRNDQGTFGNSIEVISDVGGILINSGLANVSAIDIDAVAGGLDIDLGLACDVFTADAISLDAGAASNFTVAGAGIDLTLSSAAGRVIVNGEEAADNAITLLSAAGGIDADCALQMNLTSSEATADAVRIFASDVAGGIDIDAGTGGISMITTGALDIDSAGASSWMNDTGDLHIEAITASLSLQSGEAVADAIALNAVAGGIDISSDGDDLLLNCPNDSVVIEGGEAVATAIQINASGGGMDLTAAVNDIDITATLASVNIVANEAALDAVVVNSVAGGVDIGGILDIDVTSTGGSVNVTATEAAADAIVIDASNAAGGVQISAGTAGIDLQSGQIVNYTAITNADSPYTALGTDYLISTDSTGAIIGITLPAIPEVGRTYIIYDEAGAAAGNNVTITGNAGNIVAAGATAATFVLNTAYESIALYWSGTVWLGRNVV